MVIAAATALIASAITTSAAHAAIPKPPKNSAQKQTTTQEKKPTSPAVPLKDRDTVLGKGWKTSADRAVTTAADSDGLHLLVADSTTGYAWKTVTVLSEPQLPADTWIGNSCVMDDHQTAVVYAPRTFTNKPDLMMGGAFTAIVNLDDGTVTKLPFTASLAYFDPTCNPATHTAVFTALRDTKTRLVTVNTNGATVADSTANGEITSAVPTKDGVIAAAGNRLVHVDRKGNTAELAATKHAPYGIRVTGDGTVSYIDRTGDTDGNVQTYAHGKKTTVASGSLTAMNLRQGTDGTVYLTGKASRGKGFTASGIKSLDISPEADVSTRGRLAVDPVVSPAVKAGVTRIENAGRGFTNSAIKEPAAEVTPGRISHELTITGTVPGTGKHTKQIAAEPGSTAGGTPSPALTGSSKPQMSAMSAMTPSTDDPRSHDPVDTDAWCSVPRNDVNTQALQPTPNQVEWAVDMAVRNNLRSGYLTQGGWRSQTGLGTIDPQGMFPAPTLNTGGQIPAQVELGILAQESNLWQAESGSIPGQMGSPLAAVDGYYGHQTGGTLADYWTINWDKSDCGYGVGQVTDGMRKAGYEKPGETSRPVSTQRAIAIDYATNIAASLYILADKWNEVHQADQTIAVNNDNPAKPENWFTAVWNYNLGFNKKADAGTNGNWGLGWYNNPANPVYPASRKVFMNTDVDPLAAKDAAKPQQWPYEEKVMGWAAWSIDTGFSYGTSGRQDWPGESGFSSAGFRPAYWNGADLPYTVVGSARYNRAHVSPPLDTFCNTKNNCDTASPPSCPDAACYTQYWWHEPNATWKSDCATTCGFENIKYQNLINEPGRGYRLQHGTPVCSGAPSGAKVVGSVPAGTNTWSDCGTTTTDGSFQFTFYPDPNATGPGLGQYDAKADLHQIGGGYQGHFWYTHARDVSHLGGDGGRMTIDGAWKLNQPLPEKQAMVYVHVPDTGAQATEADYEVVTPFGIKKVTIDQSANESNKWVSLGAYRFNNAIPEVRLSNTTSNGAADQDIAWGAVAFVPGDYSGMPSITFPNPDDSAPMPSWDGDVEEAHRNTGLPSAALSPKALTDGTSRSTCSKTDKKGAKLCLTIGEPAGKESPLAQKMNKALSMTAVTSIVPWCDLRTAGHDWYTRTDACLKAITPLTLVFKVNDKVVGIANFAMQQEIKLYNNTGEFDQQLTLVPTQIDPALGSVTLGWLAGSTCTDCTQSPQQTDGGLTWLGPEDTHAANVSFQTLWNGTGQEKITLGWNMTGKISAYPEVTEEASLGNTLGDLDVRCDDITKGATSAGCVFPAYTPTYTVNTDRYPAAGAYYWLMKEKNSHHYGSKEHNAPLHYLANGQTNNRALVCPDSWVGRTETPTASCDEYAFATTYESGGMPNSGITSGEQCAQFYATPLNATTWTIHDDDNYALPSWSEKCGRASIPLAQNTGALAPFGRTGGFVPYNRMLDNEPFWLATPGFDHCTASDTTCTFQRTNP